MTKREHILAVLQGDAIDKIAWSPRIQLWYDAHRTNNTLPDDLAGLTLPEVERQLGLIAPARDGQICKTVYHGQIETTEEMKDNTLYKRFHTPIGDVWEAYQCNPVALEQGLPYQQGRTEHFIKSPDDYAVMEYIVEHTEYIPTYDEFSAYDHIIGQDGLPMASLGGDPFFTIAHDWIGYNRCYLELHDRKALLESLYTKLQNKLLELQDIALQSPARLICATHHPDSQMTPPPIFDTYIKPYLRAFADRLHRCSPRKYLAIHADANSKLLLNSFVAAGVDALDCFCTAPMVPISLEEALHKLQDQSVIYSGGIPSVIVCPDTCSQADFQAYVDHVFTLLQKNPRIVLGVSDNVMPGADIARIRYITEKIEELVIR